MTNQTYSHVGDLIIDDEHRLSITIPNLELLEDDAEMQEKVRTVHERFLSDLQQIIGDRFSSHLPLYAQTIQNINDQKELDRKRLERESKKFERGRWSSVPTVKRHFSM